MATSLRFEQVPPVPPADTDAPFTLQVLTSILQNYPSQGTARIVRDIPMLIGEGPDVVPLAFGTYGHWGKEAVHAL